MQSRERFTLNTRFFATVLPATGKQMSVVDMMICRLRDGKLHEQWGLSDFYSMLIQLGLMEPLV